MGRGQEEKEKAGRVRNGRKRKQRQEEKKGTKKKVHNRN